MAATAGAMAATAATAATETRLADSRHTGGTALSHRAPRPPSRAVLLVLRQGRGDNRPAGTGVVRRRPCPARFRDHLNAPRVELEHLGAEVERLVDGAREAVGVAGIECFPPRRAADASSVIASRMSASPPGGALGAARARPRSSRRRRGATRSRAAAAARGRAVRTVAPASPPKSMNTSPRRPARPGPGVRPRCRAPRSRPRAPAPPARPARARPREARIAIAAPRSPMRSSSPVRPAEGSRCSSEPPHRRCRTRVRSGRRSPRPARSRARRPRPPPAALRPRRASRAASPPAPLRRSRRTGCRPAPRARTRGRSRG